MAARMQVTDSSDPAPAPGSAGPHEPARRRGGSPPQAPFVSELERLRHELREFREEMRLQQEQMLATEAELHEAMQSYSDLYELAPFGYLTHDANGMVQRINLTGAQLLGMERGKLIGAPFHVSVATASRPRFLEYLYDCRSGVPEPRCRIELRRRSGEGIPVLLLGCRAPTSDHPRTSMPLPAWFASFAVLEQEGEAGAALHVRGGAAHLASLYEQATAHLSRTNDALRQEIIDRRRTEDALRAANTALERSNEDLTQFAYAASHDLKEPLRAITLYAQLLEEQTLPEDARELLPEIVRASERMHELLTDLLAYARAAQGDVPRGVIDVGAALQTALCNLAVQVQECGAVVTHERMPRLPAEPSHLVQVLQNLIGNALKYRTDEPPRIHVGCIRSGEDWLFSVRDNGIGIDARYHKQIFGIFKRLHGNDYSGTGIGLAICSKLIARYGGRIWVESEAGAGATFWFTWPAGDADGVQRGGAR